MKCLTADKLSQYVDQLLPEQENMDINNHLKSCDSCRGVIQVFKEEQQFLKNTLQTPTLPENFANLVLDQIEPYPTKKVTPKKRAWNRMLPVAAGLMLAVGVSASFNTSFAEWVGGLFTTEQVDDGLRMASNAGLTTRVNLEVMDQNTTFKIEDVVADSSRVALSYQIVNKDGKLVDSYLDPVETKNEVFLTDSKGNRLDKVTKSWSKSGNYGLIEFSLREYEGIENVKVVFNLIELDGLTGNWQLEVPVDLTESLKATTVVQLDDKKTTRNGISIQMKEMRFSPSSNELWYETSFAEEEQARIEAIAQKLEEKFGKENMTFANYETAVQYHLEDQNQKTVFHSNYHLGELFSSEVMFLQGSGHARGELGQVAWNDSFVPLKDKNKFTFILDGVYKTVPSDFSVKINPKELKKNPVSFEYKGNFITIKDAGKNSDYSLRKSLWPIEKETNFQIEMEGGRETNSAVLGNWILVDESGKAFVAYKTESRLEEKDENGRKKLKTELRSPDIMDTPEELTLHLISETHYEKVKDTWKVNLFE